MNSPNPSHVPSPFGAVPRLAGITAPGAPTVPLAVLGLGMMGTALASALLQAGHQVTVWNRTAAKTGPLVAQGALPADSPAAAVSASKLIIACLLTNDHVQEVLDGVGDQLAGRTIVNLTNGTPARARELAAWAAEHGASYLDGGIMAVPQMIAGPHAYVFYSGDERAFRTHQPTLAAFGDTKFVGADPGLAALYDIALLTGMYGMTVGVMQAFALARTENIPARELSELLVPWIGAMLAGVPADAEAIDSDQHLTDVSSLAVNHAAIPNFLAAFRDQGVDPLFFGPLQEVLDRAVKEGYGGDGLSRLATLFAR
ncbi:NAD(P)-dependent oxidoreductase [Streptomyces albipurpureus]|uniref:NAD(P)-binding domain-containing protein n=1 Tax=Streptomyces albipurpureus TaxID=2897419 RepID=A0ABT0UZX1_9ACTN|nr:NAD(P)-binding domain-containing protein [Streptomyces sp. CWNU-1]MCM2394019.1 NAD(P)-binding domain-containing protein [Streptomyces sp. CWNU-1]